MSMSESLRNYLAVRNVRAEHIHHPYSEGALQSAIASQVPLKYMAKAVVLEDHEGRHIMAVVPASHKLSLSRVRMLLDRDCRLLSERELADRFRDCELGAIPAIGEAFAMETLVDESLWWRDDVFMESGDHKDLLHIKGEHFRALLPHAKQGAIAFEDQTWH
ncbi:aminoacyl-tRNA deacylase [Gallaecimonas xiamenensis]|uniref:YbaK/aminoacyl-tRNA synthetase-associated domain-containing protein n=1 Tax=Gallaecimonas xiamenensis 3-C-1 TaxID=745411 RepID=K2JN96_9GAMM|nr:YbaK/EbsC family protein [Gallaecimonas xiamenensis]EKE76728.1 hypothetical protein B3C1_04005 [Gallaecimonas xiamenensis 3-C-1]